MSGFEAANARSCQRVPPAEGQREDVDEADESLEEGPRPRTGVRGWGEELL